MSLFLSLCTRKIAITPKLTPEHDTVIKNLSLLIALCEKQMRFGVNLPGG
jgi:hypothetical protein